MPSSIKWVSNPTLCTYIHIFGQSLSPVRRFETPGTVAHQAPLSMGFSRQQNQSREPFPPPGDLPGPGVKAAVAGKFFTTVPAWEAQPYLMELLL